MIFFGCGLSSLNLLECVSMNNQECKVRQEFVNVNSNEAIFYPFSIKINRCSCSCDNTSDLFAKLCVTDVVKKFKCQNF